MIDVTVLQGAPRMSTRAWGCTPTLSWGCTASAALQPSAGESLTGPRGVSGRRGTYATGTGTAHRRRA